MKRHVVVGSGPVGTAVAGLLAARGRHVRVITRRGTGPVHPLVERVAADAADAGRLRELTRDAGTIYNCVNPRYTAWERDWPPISASMIAAAAHHDAVLAITGNLYGYGPVDAPMTEHTPLAATGRKGRVRIRMWQDALAAGIRTLEVRGSDYIGAGADSVFTFALLPAIRRRRAAWVPADVDLPHTFTLTRDMARTLVTLAGDERSWGRAWHVPSNPALTIRELADRYSSVTGQPRVAVHGMPRWVMRAAGTVAPMARELAEMDYQFYRPFILDSSLTSDTFGLNPSSLDDGLRDVSAAEVPAEVPAAA